MQQYQSLKRLLLFYTLTLLIMLVSYYAMMFLTLRTSSQQHSQVIFNALVHELTESGIPSDDDIKDILARPFFQDVSYQLVMMLPSGQTSVYRYMRPDEDDFATVSFPSVAPSRSDALSAYQITTHYLIGHLTLKNGQQMYAVMSHQPIRLDWTSYQSWVPLMAAIALFMSALLYLFKRRANWEQLLLYTDTLAQDVNDNYVPTPFNEADSTTEFLYLGHSLSRISYQLHSKQRRIKTLNHRLERLVDRAPLPMLMIMRHGQISFFNQRFEQVFTTSIQRDGTYTLTDFVTGSDKATQQQLQKLSSQRVARTLLVYGLENKQAYQLHITPWFGEHGQVHGFTVLLNNVHKLITQTDSLQQKNRQLLQQLAEMTKLKSIMSHELRTPLNAIIGTLDLIDVETLSDEEKDIMTILTESSEFMLTMLNDMLDMAKIEAGKVDIIHEPVDIFEVSQQVSDLMIGNAQRQGIELLYFFVPDCPRYIHTDSNRLRQILLNLLDNAVKFTSTGYVALIVETIDHAQMQEVIKDAATDITNDQYGNVEDPTVPPSAHQQWLNKTTSIHQTWLHVQVQDTGIGIAAAEQGQLFAYFNQANTQIGRQFGGTGLGLAISNSFAQLLGGFIRLDSKEGVGSNFHLYLPCHSPSYQPVYHTHTGLARIHLIAIVNQSLSACYLQHICNHLAISAHVYSDFAQGTQHDMMMQLSHQSTTHIPVLLIDYEYYASHLAAAGMDAEDQAITQALVNFVQHTKLPKILLSMKPERGIPSTLLQSFDSFLTKPLDMALLLSELLRLTTPIASGSAITDVIDQPINVLPQNTLLPDHSSNSNKTSHQQKKEHQEKSDQETTADNEKAPLILVVEDNPTNQKITCKLLSKLGYRSIIAEDGQQALTTLAAQRHEIALILMDCRMPVMDGLQATQAIRNLGDDITIVALTANNTEDDRAACLGVGMDDFLTKPINKDKLQAMLQKCLGP